MDCMHECGLVTGRHLTPARLFGTEFLGAVIPRVGEWEISGEGRCAGSSDGKGGPVHQRHIEEKAPGEL